MAKDINSDAMSNLLQGLTSDNEAATASSSSKKDDNVKSDKRKKPSGKVKSETISTLVDCDKMAKIRSIATIEGLSIRDVIGVGINMVIEKYEKSHGAIHVKKKQKEILMKYFSSISPHPSVNKDIIIYTLENTEGC